MIEITVSPNILGGLHLYPISISVGARISESNKYDGSCEVFLQNDYEVEKFLRGLKPSERKEVQEGWDVNIQIDEWTYRHMVGGQSD